MKLSSILIVVTALFTLGLNAQDAVQVADNQEKLEVYYFHLTHRCATCNAVENETKKALEENYPEKMKSGEIVFTSLNFEDEENEEIAEKLNVSGQALIFIRGGNWVDLTDDGFLYARVKPQKFHMIVQDTVDYLF
jgi:hypothetical protein